ERGVSGLMVAELNDAARPMQRAGLVTPSAMDAVEAYDTVVADVDGALIHGPSGTLVPVGKEGELRTYVVCRKRFDQTVVQQGLEAGSDIMLESQPVSADVQPDGVVVEIVNQRTDQTTTLRSKLLIGCDGAHSWVRRRFKMGYPKEMMIGFQTEVVGYEGQERWLEMFSGSKIAPGFFAWVIPSGNGTHRIGLWSRADLLEGRTVLDCYNDLLKHPLWKDRFANITETARYCGPVPSGMIRRPIKDRVMVIGDAAGMAKPTTGGGLGPGFKQISSIADRLVEQVHRNQLSEKNLKAIAKSSWSKLKKEQDRARALRDLLVSTRTDEELDMHFTNFAKPEVIELINEIGDIEKPVPLGLALLKKVPAFRKLALQAGVKLLFT
ncbi:MAG: FAD-dependent monooxygenase, partial [Candidatus Poseidoniaceae archaeon]|nr:FAD-dependent monooxygenase [Candidatus Poseidoniaceae archaeon]